MKVVALECKEAKPWAAEVAWRVRASQCPNGANNALESTCTHTHTGADKSHWQFFTSRKKPITGQSGENKSWTLSSTNRTFLHLSGNTKGVKKKKKKSEVKKWAQSCGMLTSRHNMATACLNPLTAVVTCTRVTSIVFTAEEESSWGSTTLEDFCTVRSCWERERCSPV